MTIKTIRPLLKKGIASGDILTPYSEIRYYNDLRKRARRLALKGFKDFNDCWTALMLFEKEGILGWMIKKSKDGKHFLFKLESR